jgi:mannose-6-phosphate isomerase-like protein (cupin superfamily)
MENPGMKTSLNELTALMAATVTPQHPQGQRFARAFAHGTMSVELYSPLGSDPQTPHDQDELYFIVSGHGRLILGDEVYGFGPGDAFFVPAGTLHHFEGFSADFRNGS